MSEPDVWKIIEADAFYRQFIDKDPKVDIKSEAISQGLAVAEQLKKLTEGIALLDVELQKQVLANHDNLLSQATWIEKLENVLYVMQSHVQCLLTAVERLRNKVVEPFNKIEMQTVMLSRLQETSDLLRRVARTQLIVKRLNAQMQGNADITKASQCINELDQLCEDVDLSGLEILESDLRSVRSHRHEIESRAKLLIGQGLAAYNPAQVGTAIQVFHDLGTLDAAAMRIIDDSQDRLSKSIKQALDVQALAQVAQPDQVQGKPRGGPGRAAMPAPGNISLFRSRLWTSLEQLFEATVFADCKQIRLLQQVLADKMKDWRPASAAADDTAVTDNYWQIVNALLAKHLAQAAQGSSYVKQVLEGEYPKFLHLYLDLCRRLNAIGGGGKGAAAAVGAAGGRQMFAADRSVVEQFENAYLSRSVSRLLDPVHQMFAQGEGVPSGEEVDALIRTVSSELSVSLVDPTLSRTVAKNISKTVRLFCLKCEQMTVTSGEATQVIDACTAGQTLNARLANSLHYLSERVRRVLHNMAASLPAETASVVSDSLAHTDQLTESIVQPIMASVADAVEAIVLTMHDEDFGGGGGVPTASSSLYMRELQQFVARAAGCYLVPFHNQQVVAKSALVVAARCLDLFVRHACLVRPLGEAGRLKLAADFAQMELALSPLVGGQLTDVGPSYRVLRSFRPLLTEPLEGVASCPALGDVLPHSLVLLSLFARGPPELLSPHTGANWSLSRLSQWLDTHVSERDRLELISGAIQKYQQTVRQKGDTSFHPVYPVMVDLLERGIQYNNKKR